LSIVYQCVSVRLQYGLQYIRGRQFVRVHHVAGNLGHGEHVDEVEEELEGGGGIVLACAASVVEDPGASFACFGDDDHLVLEPLCQGVIASTLLGIASGRRSIRTVLMLLDRDLPLSDRSASASFRSKGPVIRAARRPSDAILTALRGSLCMILHPNFRELRKETVSKVLCWRLKRCRKRAKGLTGSHF
jgi:hypothetical protein